MTKRLRLLGNLERGADKLLNEPLTFLRFRVDLRHQVFDEDLDRTQIELVALQATACGGVAASEFVEDLRSEDCESTFERVSDVKRRCHAFENGTKSRLLFGGTVATKTEE